MDPEEPSDEDIARLRQSVEARMRAMNLGINARDDSGRPRNAAAAYARNSNNWLNLAAATFRVGVSGEHSVREAQTDQTGGVQGAAQTGEPASATGMSDSISRPVPRYMPRHRHRRTHAISERSSSPINRMIRDRLPRQDREHQNSHRPSVPTVREPEQYRPSSPTPGSQAASEPSTPPNTQEMEGVSTQGEQEQQQGEHPEDMSEQFSDLADRFRHARASSVSVDGDKNGLVGSFRNMDLQ